MSGAGGGVVVAGYSDVGFRCTRWLLDAGADVRLIVTHPDRPGEELWFESLVALGRDRGIPVLVVEDLSSAGDVQRVQDAAPDFLFSFYFRKMIPKNVLALAKRGALNMHGSLLPAFRGRSPINWAILKGATTTGASLHYMVEKPDAGDLVEQEAVPIGPDDQVLAVARRIGDAAVTVLERSWPKLLAGTAARVPLDLTRGSYFGGRRPEDGVIEWTHPAKEVHDLVRAVARPWPGAFTDLFGPKVTIWRTSLSPYGGHDIFPGHVELTERSVIVYCGDDRPVEILAAQTDGGPEMNAPQFRAYILSRA